MKRPLLFGAMGLAALCANAQTTVETAQEVTEGNNSYVQAEASYATLYFKYTADADQLLYINKDFNGSFLPTTDGTSSNVISCVNENNGNTIIVPVKAGQTIYLIAMTSDQNVSFSATSKAANIDGSTIATAIEGGKNRFFVPQNREANSYGGYDNKPTYIKYTATSNDVLQMTFEGYVMNATIQEGEDGTPTSFNVNSQYVNGVSTYVGKVNVEAGKTYYIRVTNYNPLFATFDEVVVKQGSSYDVAIKAEEGDANVLSKEVGKTWYTFTPSQAGFVSLTSDADLAGGTIKVYNQAYQITYDQPVTSVTGKFDLRFEATAGTTYYICIERANAADADSKFSLTLEAAKAGDTFNNPIALNANGGTETVPESNGTYYYSITVPKGQHFITVNAPSGISTDETATQTAVYLYTKDSQGNYSVTSGRNGFRQMVETYAEETTYIIAWKCDEGKNAFSFNYGISEVKDGDIASKPLTANEGENTIEKTSDTYFTYTPTKAGWLTIDTEPTINVEFWKDSYGQSKYDAVNSGFITKAKVEAGQPVIIKISGMTEEGSTFYLSMEDFTKGESIDNPIEVVSEGDATTIALPTKAIDDWYVYTAPKSGKLTISSNMSAGLGQNALYVQVGKNGQKQNFVSSKSMGSASINVFEGSIFVNEGDQVYVNVVLKDAQKNIDLNFKMADPQAGETAATAIDLTELDSYTLPSDVSRTAPIWLSIDAKQTGVYIIETPTYDPNDGQVHNTYIGADAYATDAQGNQTGSTIASASTNYDYTTNISQAVLKLVVNGKDNPTGRYLIQVYATNGETPINIIKRDIERGEDASMPIELQAGDFEMKAASYSDPIWYSVNAGVGDLIISSSNYWQGELYATDGDGMPTGSYLTSSQYQFDGSGYKLTYAIDGEQAKAGVYLIKVTQASSGYTATAAFKADVTGIDQVAKDTCLVNTANGQIEGVNGEGIEVFDITGRVVAKGKGNVNVPKGVYVVRTNSGKTVKVTVK